LGKEDDIFRIIFAGQILPGKGIHYLLQAFTELDLPDSELLLVGRIDGSMQEIVKEYTRKSQMIKSIGNVPKLELNRYYSSASVFVLPSLSDAQPLACLEAMACGLPIIVTENTGTQEIIREGKDGFVIPIRDTEAIKEKISILYQDEKLRKNMSRSVQERIQEFTWEKYGEGLIAIYQEIQKRERI
jgi:glycosyltransferase involved in cell wall biosynthesis